MQVWNAWVGGCGPDSGRTFDRMRILFVLPAVPFPPSDGGRAKVFNLLKYLSVRHKCDLICLGHDDPALCGALRTALPELGAVDVVPYPNHVGRLVGAVLQVLRLYPPSFARFFSREARAMLARAKAAGHYDVVHYDIINMAQYHSAADGVASVHSPNDATSQVYLRLARVAKDFRVRWRLRFSAILLRRFERSVYPTLDKIHVVSEADKDYLRRLAPTADINVIPISSGYSCECSLNRVSPARVDVPVIAVCGNLGDAAIEIGFEAFFDEVLPDLCRRHPELRVRVLGRSISNRLKQKIVDHVNVEHLAWVEDFEVFLTESDVVLLLDRAGAPGAKTRVVQAMALGKAVVGSEVAFEGVPMEPGCHGLVYRSSSECLAALASVLESPALKKSLGAAAASLAASEYSLEIIGPRYEALYVAACERHTAMLGIKPATERNRYAGEWQVLRPGTSSLYPILIGVALVLTILAWQYAGRRTDFSDAATLGAHTTSFFATRDGFPIHCAPGADFVRCVESFDHINAAHKLIWFGNSQLHAINQYRQGDQTAPALLSSRLVADGTHLVTFSQPNANLQEHYVMFEHLRTRLTIRQIILPVVFDDTREDGLREEVAVMTRDATLRAQLMSDEYGRKLLEDQHAKIPKNPAIALNTPQDQTESWLVEKLERNLPVWHARPQIRGDIFVGLYRLRNAVFGITPSTKRRKILSRYIANLGALEAIFKSARAAGVDVLVYIAPIGTYRGQRPYVESEYAQFKLDVQELSERHAATYANLEDLIPEHLWGQKDSTVLGSATEPDFMHFTSAGHMVLADHLEVILKRGAPTGGKGPK